MGKKKITLPKNFKELIEVGDITSLKDVFTLCELDARGGYSKSTALSFFKIPDELVRWLVAQGADVNAPDTYGETPLHAHARSWCGNVQLLLDLGADIEATDNDNKTPLHTAAESFKPKAVQTLVNHDANVNARNKSGQTSLAYALSHCRNADIVNMAVISDILINAGTPILPEMKDSVERIGKDFEFHREGFNKEYLNQTDEALLRLYKLFDVEPVEQLRKHNGIAPITVTAKSWQAQHNELWNLLVPSSGHAKTVQGEVIRITGRVSHEILDNGSVNWDNDYRKMLDALIEYFGLGNPLDDKTLQEVAKSVKKMLSGNSEDATDRLCEFAVQWVLANVNPIVLEQPEYKR